MLLLGNITSSLPQRTSHIHPNAIIHLLQLGKQRQRKVKQHIQGYSAKQCQNGIKNLEYQSSVLLDVKLQQYCSLA